MKKLLLIFISLVTIPSAFASGCRSAVEVGEPRIASDGKLTVEEANEIIGLPIPVPEYLPPGYEIASVRIANPSQPPGPWWNITLTMENGQPSESITLEAQGLSLGMKLPPGVETVKVGDSTAMVSRNPDVVRLTWAGKYGRMLTLTGNAEVRFEELVKIAESVTAPPTKALETSFDPETDLLIMRGESRDIIVHLKNNSTKDLAVSVTRNTGIGNVPAGIDVTISRGSLTLTPGQSLDVTVNVKVGATAPSPAWQRQPASSILSTDPPPPFSGGTTEEPYYYLQFLVSCRYTAGGVVVRDSDGFSTKLRVDPPPALPEGMVTLQAAEEAADFPVAMLLPAYFPEGVSPPPLGYQISTEEPHSITVFYSSFQVVLSPEPGITQPPENIPGERTTIRKKQVVIGQGRIDWWVYDIHFSVISDELPMSELKLIAESMMLIGVYSGSWLGVGR